MTSSNRPPILLYLYPFSPFGRKISAYLSLRQIPFTEVHQPPLPPRPDLDLLSIRYRRIPLMSIGRDIYCDSKIMLHKLDELFPASEQHPGLRAEAGKARALEMLLEGWATDVVFQRVCMALPPDLPAINDKNFTKDRSELWGGEWGPERQRELNPKGHSSINDFFDFLETLMAEDKDFASGDKPGLADIHALVYFDWLLDLLPGVIPSHVLSSHPKTASWISRYSTSISTAKSTLFPSNTTKDSTNGDSSTTPNPPTIDGPTAARQILSSAFAEPPSTLAGIDAEDPLVKALGLKEGDMVDVFPEDIVNGYRSRDTGRLVVLGGQEVAVEFDAAGGGKEEGEEAKVLRVHFPRWNYKVQRVAVNGAGVEAEGK